MKGALQTKIPEQVSLLVEAGVYNNHADACSHFVDYILRYWMPHGGGLFEFNDFFAAAPATGTIAAMSELYNNTEPHTPPRAPVTELEASDAEFIERIRLLQRAVTDQVAQAVDKTRAMTQPMQFDGHAARFVDAHHAVYDAIWLHATEMLPHLKTAVWEVTVPAGGKSFILQYATHPEQDNKAD